MTGSICNKLFRNSIIHYNKLRLNKEFNYREDEEFLLRYILLSQVVAATKEGGYVYTVPDLYKYNEEDNLETYFSMYSSVVGIYEGKANDVTDSYQIELCNEWLTMLRNKFHQTIKLLPRILGVIGLRIFRIKPIKATVKKIVEFIKK